MSDRETAPEATSNDALDGLVSAVMAKKVHL